MGFLTKQPVLDHAPETLEDILLHMAKFGQPKVSMVNTGWHSWIQLHVSAVGATVEVKSDFGIASPLAAARQCNERMMQTIRDLGGKA